MSNNPHRRDLAGFRDHRGPGARGPGEALLLDRAQLLTLTAPEMTALVGGLRAIGVATRGAPRGALTDRPGALTRDFFVNLLDMRTAWKATSDETFEGVDRATGATRWTATRADLAFGSHAQLRAIAEVYASDDAEARFLRDFVAAWVKVMELDRFDLR